MVCLVMCTRRKRTSPSHAEDLYISPLFRAARAYAERYARLWRIISAKHGLIAPGEWIAPYDVELQELSLPDRRRWAERIGSQVASLLEEAELLVILADATYVEPLLGPLEARGIHPRTPLAGIDAEHQISTIAALLADSKDPL